AWMQRRIATLERFNPGGAGFWRPPVFRKASAAMSVRSIWVSQKPLATIFVMGRLLGVRHNHLHWGVSNGNSFAVDEIRISYRNQAKSSFSDGTRRARAIFIASNKAGSTLARSAVTASGPNSFCESALAASMIQSVAISIDMVSVSI